MAAQHRRRRDEHLLQNPSVQELHDQKNATVAPLPALYGSSPSLTNETYVENEQNSSLTQAPNNPLTNLTVVMPSSTAQPVPPSPKFTLAPKATPHPTMSSGIPPQNLFTKAPSSFSRSKAPSPGGDAVDSSTTSSATNNKPCNLWCQVKSYPSSVAILLILLVGLVWRRVMVRRRQHPGDRDRGQYRQLANMLSADDVFDDAMNEDDEYFDEYGLELSDVHDTGDLSLDEVNG